ncbi:2-methylcitrate dehydratase PrpD [Monaibacterium marinum]|uniref:2-methylcitrate dehydratase PrpD n=1 Tax=Pontivivens marinum TaxID=1690039 RepID=A0A2C9CSR6_9RHOB|nr:MmgE/PrpD family protein [Monaibacterium marinum]SOH94374.1 2-methylcitrate dehydratase PrpD [Monaibacterium marinum]
MLAMTLAKFATAPMGPNEVMAQFVRFSLFDWASVGIAGRDEPVATASRQLAMAEGGDQATLFGGGRATARAAALANGATSHALDYDDTHFGHIGHPSVAIIPAALAMAEQRNATGQDFLNAVAIGLEVACRVGDWMGRSHYDAGFHQTGTSGAFGATAAAGRVLGLSVQEMAHALSLTATRAAGLKSQFGSMGKPLNAGFAAEVGVTCAMLAAAGVQSAPDAIEGVQGFGPTHVGSDRMAAFDGMGQAWIFPRISYKFHACCHGLHAMLEALRDVTLPVDAIETVTVHTHPRWLKVCNQLSPETGLQAKFSYRLTAAMSLSGVDTAALDSYSDAICARPDLIALRDRVVVHDDDSLADTQARVIVRADGQDLEVSYDLLAQADLTDVEARLRAKSASLLGQSAANDLWRDVTSLGTSGGVTELAARI